MNKQNEQKNFFPEFSCSVPCLPGDVFYYINENRFGNKWVEEIPLFEVRIRKYSVVLVDREGVCYYDSEFNKLVFFDKKKAVDSLLLDRKESRLNRRNFSE